MTELDHKVKAMSNGQVTAQALSNGSDDQPSPPAETGIKEVVVLEKKLEDLKSKNDVSDCVRTLTHSGENSCRCNRTF